MVSKKDTQKTAPEDFQRQIFEELKELEEQRAKEALALVQKKRKLIIGERERTRTKGWRRQEQQVHGPEGTAVLLLVLAHRPWPSTQTKQCLLPPGWRERWMRRCPNRLGRLWQREGKRLAEH